MNNGLEFERYTAKKLEDLGWKCIGTPKSGDFGADLICTCGNEKLVVQCKDYSEDNYVGVSAIQETVAAQIHYKADQSLLVYQGRITNQARQLGSSTGVEVVHIGNIQHGWILDRSTKGAAIRRQEEIKRQIEERTKIAERESFQREKRKTELDQYNLLLSEYDKQSRERASSDLFTTSALVIGFPFALMALFALPAVGIPILIFYIWWYFLRGEQSPQKPVPPDWITDRIPSGNTVKINKIPNGEVRKEHEANSDTKDRVRYWKCTRCSQNLRLKTMIGTYMITCPKCKTSYSYNRENEFSPPHITN